MKSNNREKIVQFSSYNKDIRVLIDKNIQIP